MDKEIEKPDVERPVFSAPPYDYRNLEKAGKYRGVGYGPDLGKKESSNDCYAMPKDSKIMGVPRDHEG